MSTYFVIFGAAVRPDGTPSATLDRRIQTAIEQARDVPRRMFVATGGIGRHGPAEANVIRDGLVAGGIDPGQVLIEDRATDTLESALFCNAILRRRNDVERLVPCSSGYHNPRCALLFLILGYRVRFVRVPSDRQFLGFRTWAIYVLKEIVALPYDATLILAKRVLGRVC